MQFPRSLHAEGWRKQMPAHRPLPDLPLSPRDADAVSPSLHSRRFHAVAMLVIIAALGASAGLDVVDDPRPLDVQMSAALHRAGDTLRSWQEHLSRGLQVSLRAVADGRDATPSATPPDDTALVARADAPATAADADDRDQPVRADVAPRQLQPTR